MRLSPPSRSARRRGRLLQVAVLVEHEEWMISGVGEVAAVHGAFLRRVRRAHAAVDVEHQHRPGTSSLRAVNPTPGEIGERRQVRRRCHRLRSSATRSRELELPNERLRGSSSLSAASRALFCARRTSSRFAVRRIEGSSAIGYARPLAAVSSESTLQVFQGTSASVACSVEISCTAGGGRVTVVKSISGIRYSSLKHVARSLTETVPRAHVYEVP